MAVINSSETMLTTLHAFTTENSAIDRFLRDEEMSLGM
jgi:hypothetical protein